MVHREELKQQDPFIYDEIFNINVYGLKENDLKNKTIIDIGSNVGFFTILACEQGAKKIIAVEAQAEAYGRFLNNIKYYCKDSETIIASYNLAAYDKDDEVLSINSSNGESTVYSKEAGTLVNTVTIEKLLSNIKENDLVLKIDAEGAEYDILLNMSEHVFTRFGLLLVEVHADLHPKYKGFEIIHEKLVKNGFVRTNTKDLMIEYEKGKWKESDQKTFKYERKKIIKKKGVLCSISTKDRYFTTLPLAISSIANQTVPPDEFILYDDGEQADLRNNEIYRHLFKTLDAKGIKWQVFFGVKRGQHYNHELANTEGYDFVWRIDDDEVAEPDVLERLLKHMQDPKVGAVAGAVVTPGELHLGGTGKMIDILDTPNPQWSIGREVKEVDHLYSSFLYRANIVHYCLDLSPVAHREESIFSHEIKRAGYKLIVDNSIVTWHYRSISGGIRSHRGEENYNHDEKIFARKLESWGYKLICLDSGLGDHLAFLHSLLALRKKYGDKLLIGCCWPEVFKDKNVRLTSIAAIRRLATENIYEFMDKNGWIGQLKDAYKKMYEVEE